MATTKFGFRQWSSQGELRTEYWISDMDLAGPRNTPHTPSARDEAALKFTAGSLEGIHGRGTHSTHQIDSSGARIDDFTSNYRRAGNHGSPPAGLIALDGADSKSAAQGWKGIFARRRSLAPAPAWSATSSSDHSSSSPTTTPGTSIESMTTDVKSTALVGVPSSPTHTKKEGFFKRHLHHRRRSSVHVLSSDVSQSPPQQLSRPPTAARQSTSQPAKTAPQRPVLTNGQSSNHDDDYQPAPEIVLNAVNSVRDEFAGVTYPDGLTTPLTNSKSSQSKGNVKWAEKVGQTPPGRPRRTSSAATHGRRSSIYSKAAEGDYLEGVGVDAGVGSKARRLSVVLPDQLLVDECPLDEYFSHWSRLQQKEIGEGGAAVVRLMKSKTGGYGKGQLFAVKEFRARDPDEESEPDYERKIKSEYAISKSCQHPNIVETFSLCAKDGRWFHVMAYCELGDLNDLINKNYFSIEDKNCIFKQLVRGVDYLHRCGIAHRDLKSENLLLTSAGCLKIADFGTGEVFCGEHPGARNCRRQSIVDPEEPIRMCEPGWVGSRPYMAPEVYQRLGEYDPRAVDVWSCGIVYLTLWFGANVWDCASPDCKNFNIYCSTWDAWLERFPDGEIKEDRPLPGFANTKQWISIPPPTKIFLFGMLHPDPKHRWSIKDVLDNKIVFDYPCCQQEGYCDDLKKRQKKSLHNHVPPKESKTPKFLKPSYDSK